MFQFFFVDCIVYISGTFQFKLCQDSINFNFFLCLFQTISLVCLVYYLFRYVGHKIIEDSPEYKGIVYGGFVLYGFMIVTSLVIIPGVQLVRDFKPRQKEKSLARS